MPEADSPRLDNKGILLIDPGEEVKEAEWFGEPCGEKMLEVEPGTPEVNVTTFETVRIGDDIVSVGDHVYLTPDSQGEPCELGRVVAMFEVNDTGEKHFSVQWFWRPEHIVMPRTMLCDDKEVFLSDNIDNNPVESFESKCTIVQLRESDSMSAEMRQPHVFFYRRVYDPLNASFKIAKGSEPRANPDTLQARTPSEPLLLTHVAKPPKADKTAPKPTAAPPPPPPAEDFEVLDANIEVAAAPAASSEGTAAAPPPPDAPVEEAAEEAVEAAVAAAYVPPT